MFLSSVRWSLYKRLSFQTRTKYAPWMSKETKILKENREAAHKKASDTDLPEDWNEWETDFEYHGNCEKLNNKYSNVIL